MVKVCVYSLIFRDYALKDILEKLSEIGYDAIEIRIADDGVHLSTQYTEDDIVNVKNLLSEYNFKVSDLAGYAKLGYEWDRAKHEIDTMIRTGRAADKLGSKYFRIKVRGYDANVGYEKIRKLFREQLEHLIKTLKSENIEAVPVIEQHGGGDMAHTTAILIDLLRGFDPEYIGVMFDPGNSVKEGWLPLDLQIDIVKDYIKHVHVKNYEWNPEKPGEVRASPLDRGIVDWVKVVEILSKYGFDGYYSLEDFRDMPPEVKAREAFEFFKKLNL